VLFRKCAFILNLLAYFLAVAGLIDGNGQRRSGVRQARLQRIGCRDLDTLYLDVLWAAFAVGDAVAATDTLAALGKGCDHGIAPFVEEGDACIIVRDRSG
jgi:hypothetical protein